MIYKNFGIKPSGINSCIEAKLRFVLKLYSKYRSNFAANAKTHIDTKSLDLGGERYLLMQKIDEKEFYGFMSELSAYLSELAKSPRLQS